MNFDGGPGARSFFFVGNVRCADGIPLKVVLDVTALSLVPNLSENFPECSPRKKYTSRDFPSDVQAVLNCSIP